MDSLPLDASTCDGRLALWTPVWWWWCWRWRRWLCWLAVLAMAVMAEHHGSAQAMLANLGQPDPGSHHYVREAFARLVHVAIVECLKFNGPNHL